MAEYGFTRVERVIDRPGEHEVEVHGDREQLVRLGTVRNATLDVLTGCHLVEQPD